jgi:hypothetical protein
MSITPKNIRGTPYEYFEYYDENRKKRGIYLGKKGEKYHNYDAKMILRVFIDRVNKFANKLLSFAEKIDHVSSCSLCEWKTSSRGPARFLMTVVWRDKNGKHVDHICSECLEHLQSQLKGFGHIGFLFLDEHIGSLFSSSFFSKEEARASSP